MSERIVLGGKDDHSPEIVATYAGDGDVTVQVWYSPKDGRPTIQVDCEEHAEFAVYVNDGPLAHVKRGGDDIWRGKS